MHELTVNLHIHTTYSDGSASHAALGQAALKTGVDVLMISDHNTLIQGLDGYYKEGEKRVLLLVGEEVHDQGHLPQKNHLLVFGTDRELAQLAHDPQSLIDAVRSAGGICFIAHPFDPALPAFSEPDISWVDWQVNGYTGIELWNGFSELKSVAKGKWDTVAYAFLPELIPHGPPLQALARWDALTTSGQRVVAVGGSDAHAQHKSLGLLHKVIFPYEYHFSTINTHILTPAPLSGRMDFDRSMILEAFTSGHCFIGNDLPASTRGFRFTAHAGNTVAQMGDWLAYDGPLTLQAKLPSSAEIRLIFNGQPVKTVHSSILTHVASDPGVYRIEAYKPFLGKSRGWIFSNPIYIR